MLLFRLLKRLFKDLFERQGFEDDGIFDWDILKKQKEQGSGFSASAGGAAGAIDDEGEDDIDKRGGLEAGTKEYYFHSILVLLFSLINANNNTTLTWTGFYLGEGGSGVAASPRMQSTVVRPSATGR